ncbi:sulfur transferase domain-containing protein [Silanimonas sp.]|uniref:phosphatase domain-containing putative toxin n=1 Tax=Silanimonas sp. TaxID=1929290 RepID=UPI001BC48784|nr:sulfur transferase domain-containing protein [Silanimonas sp.]MBS3895233.1 hypothetical protein [Silanimonas sp.]
MAPLAVIGMATIYLYWVHVDHRLTEITRDRVYTSAAMPPEQIAAHALRLKVKAVLDFRHAEEGDIEAERAALAAIGVRHLHLPSNQNPTQEQVQQFIAALGKSLSEDGAVLMHCRHGEGRAVFFAGVYRVSFEHWTGEQAFRASQRLPRALSGLKQLFPALGRLSERNPKAKMLRELVPPKFDS